MRKYNLEGITDLWEDYVSALRKNEVLLKYTYICQVLDTKKEAQNRNTIKYRKLDVEHDIFTEDEIKNVSDFTCSKISKADLFFIINNAYYIPSVDVKNRSFPDYFKIKEEELETKEGIKNLASKFRKIKKIVFVSFSSSDKYCQLIGVKSLSSNNQLKAIDIIKELNTMNNDSLIFSSNYAEQKTINLNFAILCEHSDWISKNNIPIYIKCIDNTSGRKSLSIEFRMRLNNRFYILNSMEINHRTLQKPKEVAEIIKKEIDTLINTELYVNPTIQEIEARCLSTIPKKAQSQFKNYLLSSRLSPLESAYDVMKTDIFNLKSKTHKTKNYDGGKKKYQLALGSIVKN